MLVEAGGRGHASCVAAVLTLLGWTDLTVKTGYVVVSAVLLAHSKPKAISLGLLFGFVQLESGAPLSHCLGPYFPKQYHETYVALNADF